jgi:hypothetical protein
VTIFKETAMTAFSRRSLLQGAAAAAVLPAIASKVAFANTPTRPTAVVLIDLVGGYNALFGSAASFIGAGTFGASAGTVMQLPNTPPLGTQPMSIDAATLGTLPSAALGHIATLGVNHHLSAHQSARLALWNDPTNQHSNLLQLAAAMNPQPASLPCVVVGSGTPDGAQRPEGQVSLQKVGDLGQALQLFGITPGAMTRSASLNALKAARTQSAARFTTAPSSLRSAMDAYDSDAAVLGATSTSSIDLAGMQTAYGVTGTAVTSFKAQMMAAETMIRLGSRVVLAMAQSPGWDTHGDINGTTVRTQMTNVILPSLKAFLSRVLDPTFPTDVTLAIVGDFARSLPGSDHAACMAPTVIGPRVKVGSTGNVDANVGMDSTVPGLNGLWSFLGDAARADLSKTLFGLNPHTALLSP